MAETPTPRYRRLREGLAGEIERHLPEIEAALAADGPLSTDGWTPSASPHSWAADLCAGRYALGHPMEAVIEAHRMRIALTLRALDEFASSPSRAVIQGHGLTDRTPLCAIGESLLIDDQSLLARAITACERIGGGRLPFRSGIDRGVIRLTLGIARGEPDSRLAERTRRRAGRLDHGARALAAIALGEPEPFNLALEHEMLRTVEVPEVRTKDSDLEISQVYALHCLPLAALALSAGVAVTLRDTALPLKRFPIAGHEGIPAPLA